MSGIAGVIDLTGKRPIPDGTLERMGNALRHRGPDGQWMHQEPGVGLLGYTLATSASRQRPSNVSTEHNLIVLLDGEIYNSAELRQQFRPALLAEGNDVDLMPDLWRQETVESFLRLRGQFALAIWDKQQERLVLARDRFGVAPLHWTRQNDWLVFASEIRVLLASGLIDARPNRAGIDHVFTVFGVPGPMTCFEGIFSLLPGHYLEARASASVAKVDTRPYWTLELSFRDQERLADNEEQLLEQYEALMLQAVKRRLRGPKIAAYSSGGLDSSMLVSMVHHLLKEPIDTFTFRIPHPHLNESSGAATVAQHVGSRPNVVDLTPEEMVGTYPALVRAAESPVIDASAAALFRLAQAVNEQGFNITLTGEGADEWQAGYPWFRIQRMLKYLDVVPGVPISRAGYRSYLRWIHSRQFPWPYARRCFQSVHGDNAWMLAYMLMSAAKFRFYSPEMRSASLEQVPFSQMELNQPLLEREDWMNRSIYLGARIHLAGLHLTARGDRAAHFWSVQGRYPFLDEDLVDFLARLPSGWKLRNLRDKYLQRKLADRWLPPVLTKPAKSLLHAPLDAFHQATKPDWVEQAISREALERTGYFNPEAVHHWRQQLPSLRHGYPRLFIEMALAGVISTQLWHQSYFDPSLAEIPDDVAAGAPTAATRS